MISNTVLAAAALALGTVLTAFPTVAAPNDAPAHVRWAERLVAELTPERNAYAWDPTYVVWAEDGNGAARSRSVCSSFVSHDLERAYGFGRPEVLARFGTANPQAKDYYDAIAAGRGFGRVAALADVRPGDIIAIRYPAGSHPTGHVMIVDGLPRERASTRPVVAGTAQYEVAVIDSSRSFHGTTDTRYRGESRHGGGVGRGILRLYAARDGSIAGYAWSTRSVSRYYAADERQPIVGRFEASFSGAAASPASSAGGDDGGGSDEANR